MKTEIIDNIYVDGERVSTQKVTYEKKDDLRALGDLYHALANIESQMELEKGDLSYLLAEKAKKMAEVETYKGYIEAYGDDE